MSALTRCPALQSLSPQHNTTHKQLCNHSLIQCNESLNVFAIAITVDTISDLQFCAMSGRPELRPSKRSNDTSGRRHHWSATSRDGEVADGSGSVSHLNGVNNVRSKCEQTFNLIISSLTMSSEAALIYERQLWNDIKQYRHVKDTFLTQYLIGYYVSLIESIVKSGQKEANPSTSGQLLYNILIRVGDLNRYLNKASLAETYYLSARKLDVLRGHAYNQLAINTGNSQHLKCIYYYCRAAKSSVEPIPIAETNLKVAVNRFDCGILKSIMKSSNDSQISSDDQLVITYPQKGIDWFYLSVISVFFDSFEVVFRPLIEFLITNCELTANKHLDNNVNNDLDFALMAFDVALDWISLRANQKLFADIYAKLLREVKTVLNTCCQVIAQYESQAATPDTRAEANATHSSSTALFHDHVLRGFSPLTEVHDSLDFETSESVVIESCRLMSRVIDKLDKLFGKSLKTKRIRNVALGSILEGQPSN